MVEKIERLRAKLQAHTFRDCKSLLQRRIKFVIARAASDVAAKITPGAFGRNRKCGWIEPIVDSLIGRVDGNSRNQVRTLASGIAIW